VDSYFVGEEELDEIEKEKQVDPVNVNYKAVYNKLQDRLLSKTTTTTIPLVANKTNNKDILSKATLTPVDKSRRNK
jgi:hypothetical protein